MKVTTYTINEGTASQYYGLKSVNDNHVLYYAPNNWKTKRDRIYLTAGHKIRVDIFEGYLWQVPELLRCKNWKICDSCDKGVCKTYYIDILPA